jgi:hypothetical protein
MLKFLVPAALGLFILPTLAAPAAPRPEPSDAVACVPSNPTGGDIRIVTCRLPANRGHRLTVNFGGGHDDTSASISATLDGQPTQCGAGSKTSLFAEDGDVSLSCRIDAAGDAVAVQTLVVTVLWSHAQYRDFVVVAE